MAKIQTSVPIVNLNGDKIQSEDGKNLTIGVVLANIILSPHANKKGFRPLKSWELAQKLYKNPEVEVDNADFIQIKEIVENSDTFSTMVVAQVLEALEKIKEE